MIKHQTLVSRIEGSRRNLEITKEIWEKLLSSGQEFQGGLPDNLSYLLGTLTELTESLDDIFPECTHFSRFHEETCAFISKSKSDYSRS